MGSKFVPDEFRINSGYVGFHNHITTVFLAQRGGCFDKSVGYIWLLLDVPVDVAGDAAAGHGAVPELEVLALHAVGVRGTDGPEEVAKRNDIVKRISPLKFVLE